MKQSQVEGMMFGLGIGDAMGYQVEFDSLSAIKAKFGMRGVQELPYPALYSDDSQMTFALAESLLDVPADAPLDTIMQAVGKRFLDWSELQQNPHYNRAPGNACMSGLDRYRGGISWHESGDVDSKGCGAAMRVAPLGLLYRDDPAQLKAVAQASAVITHRHPAGVASAVAAAYAVKLALDELPIQSLIAEVSTFTAGMSDDLDAAFSRVGHAAAWSNEEDALKHIGEGWVGEEAVALALYCVLRYPNDFAACIRRASTTNGDSDSIACIAGSIIGARLGIEAIPAHWIAQIESQAYIADLAARLAARYFDTHAENSQKV
jgi:ADP-ribosylglycohydrolase